MTSTTIIASSGKCPTVNVFALSNVVILVLCKESGSVSTDQGFVVSVVHVEGIHITAVGRGHLST